MVLARDQAQKWPWLEQEGDLGKDLGRKVARAREGIKPKRDPGSTGKVIWAETCAEKCLLLELEGDLGRDLGRKVALALETSALAAQIPEPSEPSEPSH